jgi:NAD-dependent deacetylase
MSLDSARRMIAAACGPVVFSGAGLSAESGIATFRDAGTGLWSKSSPEQLASPQGFAADPRLVIAWYDERRRALARARPNRAHLALARQQWPQVTQNVDDLLQRAGARDVIQLHGSITHDRCHGGCGHAEAVERVVLRLVRRWLGGLA